MSRTRPTVGIDHLVVKRIRSANGERWLWRTRFEIWAFKELNRRKARANRIDTAGMILGFILVGAFAFAVNHVL